MTSRSDLSEIVKAFKPVHDLFDEATIAIDSLRSRGFDRAVRLTGTVKWPRCLEVDIALNQSSDREIMTTLALYQREKKQTKLCAKKIRKLLREKGAQ